MSIDDIRPLTTIPLDKLTAAYIVNKFLAFNGMRRYVAMLSTSHHWTLPGAM
jgi:hypothetical protein